MAGSVALIGGPATGLAFAPLYEQAGLEGAAELDDPVRAIRVELDREDTPLARNMVVLAAAMEFMGGVALNIFLVVALMDLKLRTLAGQALPLLVILAALVALVALVASTASFRLMGRDYDSAVMSGGFVGFALGTTANAIANMRTVVERFGPAPRAFLLVPLVGAFFIDFTNALIITRFINWLG